MPLIDAAATLSGSYGPANLALSGQAISGTDTSVLSTNTLDAASLAMGGNQVGDLGRGAPLEVAFQVTAAPTGGTSVVFQVIQADDAALSSNVDVLNQSSAIPVGSLGVGSKLQLQIRRAAPLNPKRYIGARYVLAGAVANMAVHAHISAETQSKAVLLKNGFVIA